MTAKQDSFQSYINTLAYNTPSSDVWKKIKCLKGNYRPQYYRIVIVNKIIEKDKEKCDKFAASFVKIKSFD